MSIVFGEGQAFIGNRDGGWTPLGAGRAEAAAAEAVASLDEHAETMVTGTDDDDDDGWVCGRCKRGKCGQCADPDCTCCNGNPGDS